MDVRIYPSRCSGMIKVPPSKSMSHRALICAALACGKSKISNISYSDDVKTTIDCLQKLGAHIECHEDHVIVEGIHDMNSIINDDIFCKESGSTLRFMIPIFSLTGREITFTGENRLLKRPQDVYRQIFKGQGLFYQQDDHCIKIKGKLKYGSYQISGEISSQFISGLLFALPLLDGDSVISVLGKFESRSYVEMTVQILKKYGIQIEIKGSEIYVPGNQKYITSTYEIEGDYSQFAFFAVLAAINNDLKCIGLAKESLQGDKVIIDILKKFGCEIQEIQGGISIKKRILHHYDTDLEDCPDIGPILNILMMYANGRSRIYNAKRLRYKESDRIEAMETELKKCGVDIVTTEDEIVITGKERYDGNISLDGHKDHRIVMSLCVAATMFESPALITGAESINKSYPGFFKDMQDIGIKIDILK